MLSSAINTARTLTCLLGGEGLLIIKTGEKEEKRKII